MILNTSPNPEPEIAHRQTSIESLEAGVLSGDRRSVARAISAVESGEPEGVDLLRRLFAHAGETQVIGITGSPGTGKSTLVEKLAQEYRRRGDRVGIIAVDPTSPFSGGAILGDRIRMQALSQDDGVYLRSMATHARLGGLAPATHDAVTVLAAAGCRVVLVETVGVGQDEVEIARLADATVVLLVPGLGDDLQAFKAGVMEIADLFVINKSDLAGAERVEREVSAMLSVAPRRDGWCPPVVHTTATTGEGITALLDLLERFRTLGEQSGRRAARESEKWMARLLEMLRQAFFDRIVARHLDDRALTHYAQQIAARERDPHSIVDEIMAKAGATLKRGADETR